MTKTFIIHQLTEDEAIALFEDVHPHVVFSSGYKYFFTYIGRKEMSFDTTPEEREKKPNEKGKHIEFKFECSFEGDADDIYREEVAIDYPRPVFPLKAWNYTTIYAKGEETNYKWIEVGKFKHGWW